jgi:hypothetical protein
LSESHPRKKEIYYEILSLKNELKMASLWLLSITSTSVYKCVYFLEKTL